MGLKQLLTEEIGNVRITEAQDAQEVIASVRERSFHIVVLDLSMPGRSGLDILEEIRRIRPHLPVLIVSMHPEEQYALRVIRAGAAGYVAKDSPRAELVNAVRRVLAGRRYISSTLAERLAFAPNTDKAPHELLSNRELEVLHGIATGKSMTQIAYDLNLSIKTASTYRRRILEKMGLASNADLTRYALENQLI